MLSDDLFQHLADLEEQIRRLRGIPEGFNWETTTTGLSVRTRVRSMQIQEAILWSRTAHHKFAAEQPDRVIPVQSICNDLEWLSVLLAGLGQGEKLGYAATNLSLTGTILRLRRHLCGFPPPRSEPHSSFASLAASGSGSSSPP